MMTVNVLCFQKKNLTVFVDLDTCSSSSGSLYMTATPLKDFTPHQSRKNNSTGQSSAKTPSGHRINPFEVGLLDQLRAQAFSPSVFKSVPNSTNEVQTSNIILLLRNKC